MFRPKFQKKEYGQLRFATLYARGAYGYQKEVGLQDAQDPDFLDTTQEEYVIHFDIQAFECGDDPFIPRDDDAGADEPHLIRLLLGLEAFQSLEIGDLLLQRSHGTTCQRIAGQFLLMVPEDRDILGICLIELFG